MKIHHHLRALFCALFWVSAGCALIDDMAPKKAELGGLIATPATYYSTAKARYLGAKYKDNLDRLVERITRNPKTAPLQFANNISSVGGIGFFTHSATKSADERYLEVVLATPETFEVKGEFSEKVRGLFARYGVELLSIISADNEIYQDREMSGYGLNLAWRNLLKQPSGTRVALERAIIYLPKERVRHVLRQGLDSNDLLKDAVIFAVEEDGPLTLVSYRPQEPGPDIRAAIKEDNLALGSISPQSSTAAAAASTIESVRPTQAEQAERTGAEAIQRSDPDTGSSEKGTAAKLPAPAELPVAKEIERADAARAVDRALPPLAPAERSAEDKSEKIESISREPLAALKRPAVDSGATIPPAVRPVLKPLEGYVVQVAFTDREKAQRWAESMAKRGFAVSLTEAGGEGSLRLRVGNFSARDEAERQLRLFKQDGLAGIVINLPQAYRPVARTSMP